MLFSPLASQHRPRRHCGIMGAHFNTGDLQDAADRELVEKLGHGALLEARQAAVDEHDQTLWEAISQNRRAVMWSVLISMSIIMEG